MKNLIPTRLEYIDGLKVLMIFCVLFNHLPEYLETEFSHDFWQSLPELGGAGVSGFIILSGFGLTHSLLTKNATDVRVIPFFWKRFIRLVPLYYIALFTYFLVVALIQPVNLLTHLLFIHTFFKSFSHNLGSLWFIGLIVQCYLFFPLAYKLISQKHGLLLLNFFSVFLYMLGMMLTCQGLYTSDSFLGFAIEFVLGMNIARDMHTRKMQQYSASLVVILTTLALVCFIILAKTSLLYELPDYTRHSITTVGRICFFIVALNIFLFLDDWKNFNKLVPLLSVMSLASYSVYLFHRPILTILVRGPIWNWIIHHTFSGYVRFISLAVFGIPLIFLISYWIQIAHDSIQKNLLFSHLLPISQQHDSSSN